MTRDQEQILTRVEQFVFDPPGASLTFVKRFAREHKVGEEFASRAADEYLKFMFLCAIGTEELTPSHTVDLVWHLHMTYTENYWMDLCKKTLGKQIHHRPTTGGKANAARYREQYLATLAKYNDVYGYQPPDDIWEPVDVRFRRRSVAVDQNDYWVIRKPLLTSGHRARRAINTTSKPHAGRRQAAGRGRNRRRKKSDDLLVRVVLFFAMIGSAAMLILGITGRSILISIYGGLTFVSSLVFFTSSFGDDTTNRTENTGKGNDGSAGCGSGLLADSDGAEGGDSGCGGDGCGGCGGCGGAD